MLEPWDWVQSGARFYSPDTSVPVVQTHQLFPAAPSQPHFPTPVPSPFRPPLASHHPLKRSSVQAAVEDHPEMTELMEVVLDLGRPPLARFPAGACLRRGQEGKGDGVYMALERKYVWADVYGIRKKVCMG